MPLPNRCPVCERTVNWRSGTRNSEGQYITVRCNRCEHVFPFDDNIGSLTEFANVSDLAGTPATFKRA